MFKGVFVSKLNPLSGSAEWKIEPENYDYMQEVARAGFADMLHDSERNQLYYDGLRSAINQKRREGQEVHVLDIGTGTGLLSMMAVRLGADSVTACEEFLPMANIAEKVIASNGFSKQIKLIRKRSSDLLLGEDMKCRANILITEVFDTECIGEGAIGVFNHAHRELLTSDALVIPSSAIVYGLVVESDMISRNNVLRSPNVKFKGPLHRLNSLSLHDVQLSEMKTEWFKPLSEPSVVFKFDFTGKTGPLPIREKRTLQLKALSEGAVDGIFIWWELGMDEGSRVILSMAPKWLRSNSTWRDHWMQAIYYPSFSITLSKSTEFTLVSQHDEYSLKFDVMVHDLSSGHENKISEEVEDNSSCLLHQSGISRLRLSQLNDESRNIMFTNFIQKILSEFTPEKLFILVLSDSSFLPLLAGEAGKVYTKTSNRHWRSVLESYMESNDVMQRKIEFVDSLESLSEKDKNEINFVIGEPFFSNSILPWHNLHFWFSLSKHFPGYSEKRIRVAPSKACIYGLPVETKDLWKIRSPLSSVQGFSLTEFDDVILRAIETSDQVIEPHSLWEYPTWARGSSPTLLMTFDLQNSLPTQKIIRQHDIFTSEKPVNGMALWMDWHFDESHFLSNGPISSIKENELLVWNPTSSAQGLYFLSLKTYEEPLKGLLTFDPTQCHLEISFT